MIGLLIVFLASAFIMLPPGLFLVVVVFFYSRSSEEIKLYYGDNKTKSSFTRRCCECGKTIKSGQEHIARKRHLEGDVLRFCSNGCVEKKDKRWELGGKE